MTSNYSPSQAARRCALEDPQAAFPLAPGKIIEVGGYDHRAARPQQAGFVGQKNWAKSFGGGPRGVPWGEGKPLPRAGKPGAFLPPVRGSGRRKGARPPALARLQAGFTEVAPIPFRGLALRPTAAAGHGTGWPRHRRVYFGKVEPCRGCLRIASRFSC